MSELVYTHKVETIHGDVSIEARQALSIKEDTFVLLGVGGLVGVALCKEDAIAVRNTLSAAIQALQRGGGG